MKSRMVKTKDRSFCGDSQGRQCREESGMNVLLNNELVALLNTRRLPARLNVNQVAAVLGFALHDLPVLTSKRLLRTLGRPKANSAKYYAARDIEALSRDVDWLSKATQALYDHARIKKGGRTQLAPATPSDQRNETNHCGSQLPEALPTKS